MTSKYHHVSLHITCHFKCDQKKMFWAITILLQCLEMKRLKFASCKREEEWEINYAQENKVMTM